MDEVQRALPPRWLLKAFTKLNVLVYRASQGRLMHQMKGRPICLVDMVGRHSGKRVTIPLMYVPDGDEVYLVASQGGAAQHPIWHHNLIESSMVTLQVQGRKRVMVVETVSTEARPRVWDRCVECYPDYALYQARTERNSCFCLLFPVINFLKNFLFLGPDKRFLFKLLLPQMC